MSLIPEYIKDLKDKRYVLCGLSALSYSGLYPGFYMPIVLTEYKPIDGLEVVPFIKYYYIPNVDYLNYLTPLKENTNILVPTKERAIIEIIAYDLKFIDEGSFLESLEDYVRSPFYNRILLEEVANHFKVPMSKVDYWISECYGSIQ